MLAKFKNQFAHYLMDAGLDRDLDDILDNVELVPSNIRGDLGFPCFKLSKQFHLSPNQISQDFAQRIDNSDIKAVGPYINFQIPVNVFSRDLLNKIFHDGASFGQGEDTGKTILLEGWAPNTHKAIHIGHVRNFLLSESIARILDFAGNKVIKACYPGDIGSHVAKWIWYYQKFSKQEFPEKNFTKWVGDIYTLATRKIDENPDEYKSQIEQLQKDLESGNPELVRVWQETRKMCLADIENIFVELGSKKIDKRYFESDVEKPGIQIVNELFAKGIAKKSQGAIVMDLEEFGLGVFLLLKSTGASLYSTKDIALAYQKKSDFPQYDQSLYVVGLEQEHHFQQLFKTLELIGFDYDKLKHVSYGLVDLKDGKMSSRAGNVVLYEDFRDDLINKAAEMVSGRDLPADQKNQIIHDVAFSAMKFPMLLQDSEKGILFDKKQALSFEGETGPYLLYTYARCCSLLKKGKFDSKNVDYTNFDETEKSILMHLGSFPVVVKKAGREFKPNYIARYLLDLSKMFNSYYNNTTKKLIENNSSLALVSGVKILLENGFNLLGIQAPQEM